MADKKISELDAITGANTAATDVFVVVDTSTGQTKKITREELNNAIERDVLSTINIDGGTIDNTVIGGTTSAAGSFTNLNIAPSSGFGYIEMGGASGAYIDMKAPFSDDYDGRIIHDGSNLALVTSSGGGNLLFQVANQTKMSVISTGIDVTGTATMDGLTVSSGSNQITLDTSDQTTYGRLDIGHFSNGTFIGTYAGTNAAANILRFGTSGTERLRITSDGSVGIGTSSNLNDQFTVGTSTDGFTANVSGAVTTIRLGAHDTSAFAGRFDYDRATGLLTYKEGQYDSEGSTLLAVTNSGQVGIGTSSPSSRLNVLYQGNTSISGPTTGTWAARVVNQQDTAGYNGLSVQNRWANTNSYIFEAAQGWDGASNGYFPVFTIDGLGQAIFKPSRSEAMRIDSSGNVLVGTTSSVTNSILNINGGVNVANGIIGRATNDAFTLNGRTQPQYGCNFTSTSGSPAGISGYYGLAFATGSTERMRIDSSGRVGIGTSSPSHPLHVYNSSAGTIAEFRSNDGTYNPRFSIYGDNSGTHLHHTWSSSAANLIFEVGGSAGSGEKMRIDSAGRVLVGTTSSANTAVGLRLKNSGTTTGSLNAAIASGAAHIEMTKGGNGYQGFMNCNYISSTGTGIIGFQNFAVDKGSIRWNSGGTSYYTSSDYRLKENVTGISDGIERVKQLNPSRFNFISDAGITVDGFLAHEAQTVVPQAVTGEKDAVDEDGNPEYQSIDHSKFVPLLTAALQEAVAKIEDLEERVATLEGN